GIALAGRVLRTSPSKATPGASNQLSVLAATVLEVPVAFSLLVAGTSNSQGRLFGAKAQTRGAPIKKQLTSLYHFAMPRVNKKGQLLRICIHVRIRPTLGAKSPARCCQNGSSPGSQSS